VLWGCFPPFFCLLYRQLTKGTFFHSAIVDFAQLHDWPIDYRRAVELQEKFAYRLKLRPLPLERIRTVAGLDVTAVRNDRRLWAAVVILRFDTLQIIEEAYARDTAEFPYIPGLLSFRELPVVLKALRKMQTVPDVIICDGQGLAHPRFFGLACHLGVWLNLPTIGCAKSRLVGQADDPGERRGDFSPLRYQNRTVGSVLRTRDGVKPVFVSPGHLTDLSSSREIVLACGQGRRLPEPTRLAHHAVTAFRKTSS
jgi:deoxyribonuclease V